MRTIQEHNQIVASQSKVITTLIIKRSEAFQAPTFTWDMSYWKGYCDAFDGEGNLWKQVKQNIKVHIDSL